MDGRWSTGRAQDFAVVATHGEFALHDHVGMIEDIVSRDFWRPGTAVLFDHRALDFVALGFAGMRTAAGNHVTHDDRIGGGRAALLMKTQADYGRGRPFELLTHGTVSATVQIFMDEADALRWLLDP